MDRELQAEKKCLQRFSKLSLWIIEYVWAHKRMDIQEVVDRSDLPDMDSQPLSIEDSWRLRVASAQIYSIVKNRDLEHFDRVMAFLEATYRLLPRLVAPIKHMKIMFGLKTLVIMWMLREGRGMVDTVFKITQFFPSKLPQYQDQCNQHEMSLMRKNNLDFKALAQALAVDKDKREDYIKKHMEEHYGEHYAQKVEERLLHYLHQLETVIPGDTFIDKILKKNSPVTEEEKLLLEVVTSDSKTIATTLRKLLHCDVVSCRPDQVSQSLEHGENEMESSQLSKSVLVVSSPKALHKSVEVKAPLQFQSKVLKRGEEALQGVSTDSCILWKDNSHSDITRRQQTKEHGKVEEESSNKGKQETSERSREFVQEAPSFPQFCSRHQRWVKSILQECPDECSEDLLLQADVSSSPPLFQSSLSTTSSQDLTPSDLVPCPPDQQDPPSQTSTHPQTAVQVSEHVNLKDQSSGSAGNSSETKSLPQPSSTLFSPIVRLIDFVSTFKPHQVSPDYLIMSSTKQAASTSSPQVLTIPHCRTSRDEDTSFDQLKSAAPANHPATMYNVSQSCPRLSRELRPTVTNSFSPNPSAEQFTKASSDYSISTHDASQSGTLSSVCTANQIPSSTKSSQQVVPQNSIKPHPQTHTSSPFPLNTQPHSIVVSSSSFSDSLAVRSETCRVHRAQLRLSLQSQAVLLQSTLLQPYVSLTRLSAQECYRVTKGRSSAGHVEPALQGSSDDESKKEEGDLDSSFDLNTLYSSQSSGGDSEGSLIYDPDYKPCVKKKRLLLKYETAKSLNHT